MGAGMLTGFGLEGIDKHFNISGYHLKPTNTVIASGTNEDVIEIDNTKSKPYTNSRPSYAGGQVEQVWDNAKDPVTGRVYDPSGVEIKWDTNKSRNGQWDMGHIPGDKYSDMHKLYMNDTISKQEFLNWYKNPNNYRPELPSTNTGIFELV